MMHEKDRYNRGKGRQDDKHIFYRRSRTSPAIVTHEKTNKLFSIDAGAGKHTFILRESDDVINVDNNIARRNNSKLLTEYHTLITTIRLRVGGLCSQKMTLTFITRSCRQL